MGAPNGEPDEQPMRTVQVAALEIMAREVIVREFAVCVGLGMCPSGEAWEPTGRRSTCNLGRADTDDHPMNCVDHASAQAYCAWRSARLPTEAEWEYAARSGGQIQRYPWGANRPTCELAVMASDEGPGCGDARTRPPCSRPQGRTAQGLCDMGGNVAEWTADWYAADAYTYTGPLGPTSGSHRVVRGGSFGSDGPDLRTAARDQAGPELRSGAIGFRCVR